MLICIQASKYKDSNVPLTKYICTNVPLLHPSADIVQLYFVEH